MKSKTSTQNEKRILEKILKDDIEKQKNKLENQKNDEIDKLSKELENNPSKELVKLLKDYSRAEKEKEFAEKQVEKQGFDIRRDAGKLGLKLDTGGYYYGRDNPKLHPKIMKLREKYENKKEKLVELERNFLVKVYSDTGNMETILADLQAEFNKL